MEALIRKEVTEEWIEEKAKQASDLNDYFYASLEARIKAWKDFIRSLVAEINRVA